MSMLPDHTPPPWSFDDDTRQIYGPGMNAIAQVWTFEDFPCADEDEEALVAIEQDANGELMAAAPELLECALYQRAYERFEVPTPFGHDCQWCQSCLEKLRNLRDSAIARATGGAK